MRFLSIIANTCCIGLPWSRYEAPRQWRSPFRETQATHYVPFWAVVTHYWYCYSLLPIHWLSLLGALVSHHSSRELQIVLSWHNQSRSIALWSTLIPAQTPIQYSWSVLQRGSWCSHRCASLLASCCCCCRRWGSLPKVSRCPCSPLNWDNRCFSQPEKTPRQPPGGLVDPFASYKIESVNVMQKMKIHR